MSSPTLAAPPSQTARSDPGPGVVRRAGPVLSPAWTAPRTGGGPVWISLVVHLAVVATLVAFLRLGSPLAPREAGGGASREIEYIDLAFPGSSSLTGLPAPAASVAAPAAALGTSPVNGRPASEAEDLAFPAALPSVPAAQPLSGNGQGGVEDGAAGEATAGGAGAGEGQTSGGIGERLHPGYRDTRLYVDQAIEELKRTDNQSDIEKYRERLHSLIEASNDSAWAQGSHPNTDWTFKDKSGRKWGVDEKGVYVGGIRIPKALVPTPRATGTNAKLEAERQKEKDRQAIQAQEAAGERKRVQDEAIRKTRERKEAERKSAAGEEGG